MASHSKDQIRLAMDVLDFPSRRAQFLFNPSKYARKENILLDTNWVRIIEEEVSKLNNHLLNIDSKVIRKT